MSQPNPVPPQPAALEPIIGDCIEIRRAAELARRFAPTPLPILLVGPTGSGKELFAQHIHAWSGRHGDLTDVNCAAIPRDLAEGAFFGHRRGAFTGATESNAGLVEAADRGTLFLDEIDSLRLEVQAKLLRVLECQQVRRLGETAKRQVDIRLVSATREHLGPAIAARRFRLDLYQRIAGVVLTLPPLAQRGDDVILLAREFAARHGKSLLPDVAGVLRAYSWPGNVRELAAAVARAVCLSLDGTLGPAAVQEAILLGTPSLVAENPPDNGTHAEIESRRLLLDVCEAHGWRAISIAHALAVSRATLFRRLRAHRISLRSGDHAIMCGGSAGETARRPAS